MQLIVVAVGSRMPDWVDRAFAEYAQRMPAEMRIVLREVRPESRVTGKSPEAVMAGEAERIRAALPRRGQCVALDERGADCTSEQLAQRLDTWRGSGEDVAFLIGGADGLDARLKAEATMQLRLSSMTLPHGLVRVLLAEQLYRAWSITQNHPYHRG